MEIRRLHYIRNWYHILVGAWSERGVHSERRGQRGACTAIGVHGGGRRLRRAYTEGVDSEGCAQQLVYTARGVHSNWCTRRGACIAKGVHRGRTQRGVYTARGVYSEGREMDERQLPRLRFATEKQFCQL